MTADVSAAGLDPLVRPFWDGLVAGELRLPECDACAHVQWYPDVRCARCHGDAFTWRPHAEEGTVYSLTTIENRLIDQGPEPPYTLALVTLDDAPTCRVLAIVEPSDPPLAIGSAVRVVVRPSGDSPTVVAQPATE